MLTKSQAPTLILLGIVFWFSAAMMARFSGTLLPDYPVLAFAAAFPITWTAVEVTQRLLRLSAIQVVPAVAAVTAAAAFCDGIALTWFPSLYGAYPREAAAWILWGAAAGIAVAFVVAERLRSRASD